MINISMSWCYVISSGGSVVSCREAVEMEGRFRALVKFGGMIVVP